MTKEEITIRLAHAGWGPFIRDGKLVPMDARMWRPGWKSYPRNADEAINWTPQWASTPHTNL
jgi:hypothetical protein